MIETITTRELLFESLRKDSPLPVVIVDVTERDSYGIAGAPVALDFGPSNIHGGHHYGYCRLRFYEDDGKAAIVDRSGGLTATLTTDDIIRMAELHNAPVLAENGELVVVLYNPERGRCAIARVGLGRFDMLSSSPAVFASRTDAADLATLAERVAEPEADNRNDSTH